MCRKEFFKHIFFLNFMFIKKFKNKAQDRFVDPHRSRKVVGIRKKYVFFKLIVGIFVYFFYMCGKGK